MTPAVPFPCYALVSGVLTAQCPASSASHFHTVRDAQALDVETTGNRLGVDKLVAIGAVVVQVRAPFDVVEVERQTWRFEVSFPEDFEAGCVENFWSKNMEVLHKVCLR